MITTLTCIIICMILGVYGASVYKWYREEEEKRNRR